MEFLGQEYMDIYHWHAEEKGQTSSCGFHFLQEEDRRQRTEPSEQGPDDCQWKKWNTHLKPPDQKLPQVGVLDIREIDIIM